MVQPFTALYVLVVALSALFQILVAVASIAGAWQERKIWKHPGLPSLSTLGFAKVYLYNTIWLNLCFLAVVLAICKWILTLGMSNLSHDSFRLETMIATTLTGLCVGGAQVSGMEYLPAENTVPAPVYIANHASQLDAGIVYSINRRFKWIAKQSVALLPGVGQITWLSKHVFINRKKGKNGKSVTNLFDKSNAAIQAGLAMFIFPQGTRRMDCRLPPKEGAFIIAETNKSVLVPISIEIPLNAWNTLYPFFGSKPIVKLTIHRPIPVDSAPDRESLKRKCMDQIYSVLPTPSIPYESSKTK